MCVICFKSINLVCFTFVKGECKIISFNCASSSRFIVVVSLVVGFVLSDCLSIMMFCGFILYFFVMYMYVVVMC